MTKLQEFQNYQQKQLAIFKEREDRKLRRQQEKHSLMLSIAKLHQDEGLSYATIGKRKGLSRQRVHQLLKEFSTLSVK
jgi:DNA-binding transcriptional regulator LsrR (DeoR family)